MSTADVHVRSLATSTALSVYYMPDLITPHQVITVLNGLGVKFVLVGAHGIGGWMQKPRATEDVDIVVAARGVNKAVRALLSAFPHLEADDHEVVTRLRDRDSKTVAIDVIKPNQPLFREALKHTRTVDSQEQSYRIPTLEMALTLKFAPMVSLNRADKDKHQDVHDFMYMIDCNPDIDLEQLEEFGELVYPGGGKEIVMLVGQVRRGEQLRL
jgi:hypothetical protein